VFDQAGTQLYAGLPCAAYSSPKTLAPGEQAVYTSQWTTVGIDSFGRFTKIGLPAGSYTLRGALDGANVKSSTFTVSIVPCTAEFCNEE
jgi:hypothetical protein